MEAIQTQGWHDHRVENIFRYQPANGLRRRALQENAGGEGFASLLAIPGGHGQAGAAFARHLARKGLSGGP